MSQGPISRVLLSLEIQRSIMQAPPAAEAQSLHLGVTRPRRGQGAATSTIWPRRLRVALLLQVVIGP